MRSRYDVEREMRSGGNNRQQDPRYSAHRNERDEERRSDYGYDEDYERSARSSMDYYGESSRGGFGRSSGGYGDADDFDSARQRNERYFSSGRQPSGYGDYEGERPGAGRPYYGSERNPGRYQNQSQNPYQGQYQNQPYGESRQGWRGERSGYYGQQRSRYGQDYGDYAGSSSYGRDASGRYGGERGDSYQSQYYGGGGAYGMPGDSSGDYNRDAYGRHLGSSYGTASGYAEGGGRHLGGSLYAGGGGEYTRHGESQRGRGPKNYTRSDERIREEISECLADDHAIDASDVEIEVKNGVVTLSGSVNARQLKLRAEDIADRCSGVKDVQNRLTVKSRDSSGSQSLVGQGATASRNEETGKKH